MLRWWRRPTAEAIRIVLVEDHALVREGTRRILEQCPDLAVVGEAGNGEEALDLIERLQPGVAVLDIRIPKLSGIEVVRQMRERAPNTRVLVLTAYDDDNYILALMEAGALGYLLKTALASELVEAIRAVHLGEAVLSPGVAAKVARLWRRRQADAHREPVEPLTPREHEVLELAARGLRNRAIADQLTVSVRTVEGHFNSIYAKLGVSSRIEAVLQALAQGYVTLEEAPRE
ncbi:MAG: response regulator transcription factor [Chloroflexota bacterium]|nr:response regulator transcription factor [Chloroflexota bacterium]